jgi:uncharacterized membrane protein
MIDLILASLFFPLSHFLISSTSLRALLVNLIGERRYSLGYSLLAIAALVWLIFAYHHAPVRPLWGAPWWLGLALSPVILVSGILAVAGITTPNPLIVRSEALFDQPDIVQGVLRERETHSFGVLVFSRSHTSSYWATSLHCSCSGALAFSVLPAPRSLTTRRRASTAWHGMARIRGSDLEYPLFGNYSGATATCVARDRAMANCARRMRVSRRARLARCWSLNENSIP